jgi:glycosyltransferase involved in cell wall biosynthesis
MNLPRSPVLLVSKPLAPPWNDGSKNLAHELARGLASLGDRPVHAFVPRGTKEPILGRAHVVPSCTLDRRTTLAMLTTLATERTSGLWHFVSAPTARTARLARAFASLRGRRTVQTLASAPPSEVRLGTVVFADRVIALSRHTRDRALAEGVAPSRLRLVPIAITPPQAPAPAAVEALRRAYGLAPNRVVVTFPGDLEHGRGADTIVEACARMSARARVTLVLACRDKTPASAARRARLTGRALGAGLDVRALGEVPAMHALLAASDIVALPTDSLYAKVDHPLVLLEAMHLGRPVLVSEGSAAYELAEDGGAIGAAFEASALAAELDRLAGDSALRARWSERARGLAGRRTVRAMALAYESIYSELS